MPETTTTTIVLEDSPEAARIQTVTGWVSRLGNFWGEDERMARFDGSTHRRCKCGDIVAHRSYCQKCRDQAQIEKWLALPQAEWDGEAVLYSEVADLYFCDLGELTDHCLDRDEPCTPDDLRLVICTPNYLSEVDLCEQNEEVMPEDGDEDNLPDAVYEALQALNKAIRESRTPAQAISWTPGKTRPIVGSITVE